MKTNSVLGFSYKHSVNNVMRPCQHIFDIYSVGNKNRLGTLVCHKSATQIRPNYDGSVLAIDYIEVADKNKGTGTKILKFAEEYSKKLGCNGFMTLKADSSYTPDRISHIFYRKYGFSTLDKKTDKQLDKFVKHKTNATSKDFPCMLMHYPPLEKKPSGLKRLFSDLKQMFLKVCR